MIRPDASLRPAPSLRPLRALSAAATCALTLLGVVSPARAADPAPESSFAHDDARFRVGTYAEVGVLTLPGTFTTGLVGVQIPIGAQLSDLVGLYTTLGAGYGWGDISGSHIEIAPMVDFTFGPGVSLGLGPDVAMLFAQSDSKLARTYGIGLGSVAMLGARLHAGWSHLLERNPHGPNRRALRLGLDVRLLYAGLSYSVDESTPGPAGGSLKSEGFAFAPMATIGYEAF